MATWNLDGVDGQDGVLGTPGPLEAEHVSLCEALDRILNKGAVIQGDVMISVADVDLLYLGLRVVLTSIETAMRAGVTLRPRDASNGS
jgi:hypothetical protein